jgi:hypothetical protein
LPDNWRHLQPWPGRREATEGGGRDAEQRRWWRRAGINSSPATDARGPTRASRHVSAEVPAALMARIARTLRLAWNRRTASSSAGSKLSPSSSSTRARPSSTRARSASVRRREDGRRALDPRGGLRRVAFRGGRLCRDRVNERLHEPVVGRGARGRLLDERLGSAWGGFDDQIGQLHQRRRQVRVVAGFGQPLTPLGEEGVDERWIALQPGDRESIRHPARPDSQLIVEERQDL